MRKDPCHFRPITKAGSGEGTGSAFQNPRTAQGNPNLGGAPLSYHCGSRTKNHHPGAPFGESFGANIYWYVKEDGDGFISGNEGNLDYVVVVLDRRLGETTGWMGARGYDDDWDNLAAWSHMGYPVDLNSGQRPTWQGGVKVDGTDADAQSILHQADVFPGQSGGPVFGFWPVKSAPAPSRCNL